MLGLIDKLIMLLKEREQNKEKVFKNFVEPMYCAFSDAHRNYIESLLRYKEFCNDQIKVLAMKSLTIYL